MLTKHYPLCIKCHCLEVHSMDHARGIKTCRVCTPIEQRSPTISGMRFVNGYPVGGKSPAYIRSTISEQDKVRHLNSSKGR